MGKSLIVASVVIACFAVADVTDQPIQTQHGRVFGELSVILQWERHNYCAKLARDEHVEAFLSGMPLEDAVEVGKQKFVDCLRDLFYYRSI